MRSVQCVTLGTDIEFFGLKKARYAISQAGIPQHNSYRDKVGIDGGGRLVEIRSTPFSGVDAAKKVSDDVFEAIKPFKRIMICQSVCWGDRIEGVGAHIHIGWPEEWGLDTVRVVRRASKIVGIPAMMIAMQRDHRKRINDGFGHLYDSRCPDWVTSTLRGVEYRASGCIAYSKSTLRAILGLAQICPCLLPEEYNAFPSVSQKEISAYDNANQWYFIRVKWWDRCYPIVLRAMRRLGIDQSVIGSVASLRGQFQRGGKKIINV